MQEEKEEDMRIAQQPDQLLGGMVEAVCYSGFRSGQHPDRGEGAVNPSRAEILEDLITISGAMNFRLIRLYDCGENSQEILSVIKENNLDIQVLLGVWLKAELSTHETCAWVTDPVPQEVLKHNREINQQEIEVGIKLANQYHDIVVAVSVGNESLVDWNDHMVAPDTMIHYVNRVKQAIPQKVTVAENYLWWAEHGQELAQAVDFLSLHTYPVWLGKDINEGLSLTISDIQQVRDSFPEATIVITEAGWATVASEFGHRASEEKQLQYFKELYSWAKEMNMTTFFFEAFDEDWKGNPDNMMGAEKHWGMYTVDRQPKLVVRELMMSTVR